MADLVKYWRAFPDQSTWAAVEANEAKMPSPTPPIDEGTGADVHREHGHPLTQPLGQSHLRRKQEGLEGLDCDLTLDLGLDLSLNPSTADDTDVVGQDRSPDVRETDDLDPNGLDRPKHLTFTKNSRS